MLFRALVSVIHLVSAIYGMLINFLSCHCFYTACCSSRALRRNAPVVEGTKTACLFTVQDASASDKSPCKTMQGLSIRCLHMILIHTKEALPFDRTYYTSMSEIPVTFKCLSKQHRLALPKRLEAHAQDLNPGGNYLSTPRNSVTSLSQSCRNHI